MNSLSLCPACRNPIPPDAPGGICPSCALLGVAQPTIIMPPQGAPTRDEVSAAFPDMEVLEMIGQGGMGVVFKARQPRLDRLVALKILPPHLAAQPGFTERFTREARALAKLNHPNIVAVYDFGESGGFCYLVMEFVDGVNLRQAMRAGVKPEQAMLLVPRICEALQFAHDRGVLHRDIKPENILLDMTGTPKLADFGIAKLAGDNSAGLTLSGAALGTAAYMAPEQIEKPATVDHRADIYSLGVVFYEMLTGELPIGRFAAPSQKSKVGESVDEVVLRALEKERDRRQQSATEMKTQVESVRGEVPFTSTGVAHSDEFDAPEPFMKHLLKILTALAGIGIPASAVMPGMARMGLTPAVMVFVCAAMGALYGMWPGSPRRRRPATVRMPLQGSESRSSRTLFGYPLYHFVNGIDPATGRPRVARGIFAVGGEARGFLAIGGRAHGIIAIGGMATGIVAFGGIAAGLLTGGGLSLGLLAAGGGMACGGLARGGVAIGYNAEGGLAIGHIAEGGKVITDAPGPPDTWALLGTDYLVTAALTVGAIVGLSGILVLVLTLFTPAPEERQPRTMLPRGFMAVALTLLLSGAGVMVFKRFHSARGAGSGNFQTAPPIDVVQHEPFTGHWKNGSVELVAVTEHPSGRGPQWRMDGRGATEGPFTWPGGEAFRNRGERAYEFVIHVHDLPEGASSPVWLIEHVRATAGGGTPALKEKPKSPLPGYFAMVATLPDSIDRTNIKVGVAFDQWESISESAPGNFGGRSFQHGGVNWKITQGTAIETKDGDLAVTFTAPRPADWETRVVAVDATGKEIITTSGSRVNEQSEWRFPGLTLAAVKEFRFQVRRIDWVEFRGVSRTRPINVNTGNFAATRWTLVVQARGGDAAAQSALSELCAAYYAPVIAFLRGEGRDEDAARELAHGFFARVLSGGSLRGADPARGRFRSYLLGAVKHFLADLRDKSLAEKRGGGALPVSLDDTSSGFNVPGPELRDSERAFDRQWALTIIARALTIVETELRDAGKSAQFDVLKPWITGECPAHSQSEAAAQLNMSEGAVKVSIHRLRQRFREAVKAEIAQTVPTESDIDDELRHLIAVLTAAG